MFGRRVGKRSTHNIAVNRGTSSKTYLRHICLPSALSKDWLSSAMLTAALVFSVSHSLFSSPPFPLIAKGYPLLFSCFSLFTSNPIPLPFFLLRPIVGFSMCQSGPLGVLQAPEGCWERQEPWSQTLHVSAFEKHDSFKALWVQIHHYCIRLCWASISEHNLLCIGDDD